MPGTVVTLLHCDGTNGSTTLTDTGVGARTWTAHNGAALSTAVHAFGTASILLDGVNDYFETPASSDFAFAGDFTIEFRAKKSADGANSFDTALTTDTSDGSAINGWFLELSAGRGFVFAYNLGVVISATPTINDSTLHAWAIDRSGSTIRLYKDGAVLATATDGTSYSAAGPLGIGGSANAVSFTFAGNVDEVRITNGQAMYAGAYTPAASAFSDPGGASPQTGTATGIAPTTTFGTPLVLNQVEQATGFSSTAFGTPFAVFNQTQVASGFQTGAFGVPARALIATGIAPTTTFGAPFLPPIAVGFRTTAFGTPSIPLIATGIVPTTTFGTAIGFQHWQAIALAPTAQFGTPTTPTNRTQDASGFSSTHIGAPTAVRLAPPLTAQEGLASGVRTTAFGLAATAATFVGDATGFTSTTIGAPASSISDRVTASAVAPQTALGTPTVLIGARASGMRSTGFGTPSVKLGQPATSTYRATRFGLPTCVRSNAYLVRQFGQTSRVGHPRAFNRFNHPATAIGPTAAFGTPSVQQGHRVTAMAPGNQFGTPLLQRNPQC